MRLSVMELGRFTAGTGRQPDKVAQGLTTLSIILYREGGRNETRLSIGPSLA